MKKTELSHYILAVLLAQLEQGKKEVDLLGLLPHSVSLRLVLSALRYLQAKEHIHYNEAISPDMGLWCQITSKGIEAFEEQEKEAIEGSSFSDRVEQLANFFRNGKVLAGTVAALFLSIMGIFGFSGSTEKSFFASLFGAKTVETPQVELQLWQGKETPHEVYWSMEGEMGEDALYLLWSPSPDPAADQLHPENHMMHLSDPELGHTLLPHEESGRHYIRLCLYDSISGVCHAYSNSVVIDFPKKEEINIPINPKLLEEYLKKLPIEELLKRPYNKLCLRGR